MKTELINIYTLLLVAAMGCAFVEAFVCTKYREMILNMGLFFLAMYTLLALLEL